MRPMIYLCAPLFAVLPTLAQAGEPAGFRGQSPDASLGGRAPSGMSVTLPGAGLYLARYTLLAHTAEAPKLEVLRDDSLVESCATVAADAPQDDVRVTPESDLLTEESSATVEAEGNRLFLIQPVPQAESQPAPRKRPSRREGIDTPRGFHGMLLAVLNRYAH